MKTSIKKMQGVIIVVLSIAIYGCSKPIEKPDPEDIIHLKNPNNYTDSLYNIKFTESYQNYQSNKDYDNLAKVLVAKGNTLDYYMDLDSVYLDQCVGFIQKHGEAISKEQNLSIRYYIGSQYDFCSKKNKSKRWLFDAVKYSDNPEKETLIGFSYLILSEIYKSSGDLDSAQLCAINALKVFETTQDTVNIGTVQYNLYRIASSMNDEKKANQRLDELIRFGKISKDTLNICKGYLCHALHSSKTSSTLDDLIKYQDTLQHYLDNWSQNVSNYHFKNSLLKTHIHITAKDSVAAEKEFLIAKSLANLSSYRDQYDLNSMKLELQFLKTGNIDKELFKETLIISKEIKDYYQSIILIDNILVVNEKESDFESAYSYLKQRIDIRDSLWNQNLKSKIYEYEAKYESIKKEQKITEQKNSILEKSKTINLLIFGIVSIGLVLILYLSWRRRLALKNKNKLQESYTHRLLQNTENERSRIAGDLHDSVNHKLLQLSKKAKKGEKVSHQEFSAVIDQIRSISHNLHPAMFENIGLENSIEGLVLRIMETTSLKISTQIAYTKVLNTQQELQLYRIIEEALNNIIKHSKATHAFIKVISNESNLEMKVKDNGDGYDVESAKNKNSFGLMNIEQRSKSIKGSVSINSNNSGTELDLIINT